MMLDARRALWAASHLGIESCPISRVPQTRSMWIACEWQRFVMSVLKRRLGRPEILLHDPVWGRQAGHWLKFSTSNHVASVYTSRAHILPPVQGCRPLSRSANGPGASIALWSKRPEGRNASRTTVRINPHHSFIPG
jgi:hypothetical protein